MSRSKPNILLSANNEKTRKIEEILEAEFIYAIYYKDGPINIKIRSEFVDHSQPKYRKTSFPNRAHAVNLANRLNKKYNTTEFYVVKLQNGEIVK